MLHFRAHSKVHMLKWSTRENPVLTSHTFSRSASHAIRLLPNTPVVCAGARNAPGSLNESASLQIPVVDLEDGFEIWPGQQIEEQG